MARHFKTFFEKRTYLETAIQVAGLVGGAAFANKKKKKKNFKDAKEMEESLWENCRNDTDLLFGQTLF